MTNSVGTALTPVGVTPATLRFYESKGRNDRAWRRIRPLSPDFASPAECPKGSTAAGIVNRKVGQARMPAPPAYLPVPYRARSGRAGASRPARGRFRPVGGQGPHPAAFQHGLQDFTGFLRPIDDQHTALAVQGNTLRGVLGEGEKIASAPARVKARKRNSHLDATHSPVGRGVEVRVFRRLKADR